MKVIASTIHKMQNTVIRDINGIKRYKEHPIENASLCCSYAACAVAFVGFIVAVVMFAVNGGYGEQIETIKVNGAASIEKTFSNGTVSILYSPLVSGLVLCLMAMSVILMIVDLYKTASVVRKVFASVILALLAIDAVITVLTVLAISGKFDVNTVVVSLLKRVIETFGIENEAGLALPLFGSLAVLIILLYLVIQRKRLFNRVIAAGLVSFACLPLLTLVVENLLALAAAVVFVVIAIALLLFIGKSVAEGLRDSANEAAQKSSEAKKEKQAKTKTIKKEETIDIRTVELPANTKIYTDEGRGIGAPLTKCIFADMPLLDRKFICTVKDFNEGKVIIKRGGKILNGKF